MQTITIGLTGLTGLYKCVNDALNYLPLISQHNINAHVKQLVNGSSKLLEACTASRDMLSRLREAVVDLQSSDEKLVEVSRYFCTRKEIMKRARALALRLREVEGELMTENAEMSQNESELTEVFRCVSIINISVMESVPQLLSLKPPSSSRFSRISKMLVGRSKEAQKGNELRDVEVLLHSMLSRDEEDEGKVANAQERLDGLEAGLRGIENGLINISSQLTKARASLLKHSLVR